MHCEIMDFKLDKCCDKRYNIIEYYANKKSPQQFLLRLDDGIKNETKIRKN